MLFTSTDGRERIKDREGIRLEPYRDGKNGWSIGYGHYSTTKPPSFITESQAEHYFETDIEESEKKLRRWVTNADSLLNQSQFDALVSFMFTINYDSGAKAGEYTLHTVVMSNPDSEAVGQKIMEYRKSGGQISQGLINRRTSEVEQYYEEVDCIVEATEEQKNVGKSWWEKGIDWVSETYDDAKEAVFGENEKEDSPPIADNGDASPSDDWMDKDYSDYEEDPYVIDFGGGRCYPAPIGIPKGGKAKEVWKGDVPFHVRYGKIILWGIVGLSVLTLAYIALFQDNKKWQKKTTKDG